MCRPSVRRPPSARPCGRLGTMVNVVDGMEGPRSPALERRLRRRRAEARLRLRLVADASLLAHHHAAPLRPAADLTEVSELRRVVTTLQSQLAQLQEHVEALIKAAAASEATAAASGPAATPSTTPASATSAWGPGGSAWGPRPTASASATAPASPTPARDQWLPFAGGDVSGPMTDVFGSIPATCIFLETTLAGGPASWPSEPRSGPLPPELGAGGRASWPAGGQPEPSSIPRALERCTTCSGTHLVWIGTGWGPCTGCPPAVHGEVPRGFSKW